MAHLEYVNNINAVHDILFDSHKQLIANVCGYLNCSDRVDEITAKFLDAGCKPRRAKRDPKAPRKAKSAYMFFCDSERPKLPEKAGGGQMSCIEMAKELGERWRKLEEKDKTQFRTSAEADKTRYNDEMQAYKNTLWTAST